MPLYKYFAQVIYLYADQLSQQWGFMRISVKSASFTFAMMMSLSSCGYYKWWGPQANKDREVASVSVKQLLNEDEQTFSENIQDKINALHIYYVLGQKFMGQFDREIPGSKIENIYESEAYLSLLAIRTQTEEIEHEIIDVWESTKLSKDNKSAQKKKLQIQVAVSKFADISKANQLSMENLVQQLSLPRGQKSFASTRFGQSDILEEIKRLEITKEFQVFEKNIEKTINFLRV